jgi:hypothetical protein
MVGLVLKVQTFSLMRCPWLLMKLLKIWISRRRLIEENRWAPLERVAPDPRRSCLNSILVGRF